MKAAIIGVGRMGSTIAYAMDKLGFDVLGLDADVNASASIPPGQNNGFLVTENLSDIFKGVMSTGRPDVVISSLPYHQTEKVALWCIDNSLRYCDLGGHVGTSRKINEYASRNAQKPIMTDLGLAPGWVNILAEQGCKEVHRQVDSVKMMVGGIPSSPQNHPLNYAVTWSIDGLINEYKDDCLILENGKVETKKGMDGLEEVYIHKLGKTLEAFFTSGGASHTIESMKNKGIKNCSYKTLRWKGHRDIVRFLIRDCNLSKECLLEIFEKGCKTDSRGDFIIIKAEVKGGDVVWNKEIIIQCDPNVATSDVELGSQGFTGMQKATAFAISSVAAIIAEGRLDDNDRQKRDYWTKFPKNLSYENIPFDIFDKNLNTLGIKT